MTTKWLARDCNGDERVIKAETLAEAVADAEDWVRGGDWHTDEGAACIQVNLWAWDEEEDDWGSTVAESITVSIEQDVPDCGEDDSGRHDWQSPYETVGGIEANPGVWGHGGGVIIEEVCVRCGCGKTTDTWATDMSTGRTYKQVTYEAGRYVRRRDGWVAAGLAADDDYGGDDHQEAVRS